MVCSQLKMEKLETPCLILDVNRVKTNAARMSDVAHRNDVRLRPHIKTHKCIEVARIQTEGHDGAITVANEDHLGSLVKKLRIGLGDVEAAESVCRRG